MLPPVTLSDDSLATPRQALKFAASMPLDAAMEAAPAIDTTAYVGTPVVTGPSSGGGSVPLGMVAPDVVMMPLQSSVLNPWDQLPDLLSDTIDKNVRDGPGLLNTILTSSANVAWWKQRRSPTTTHQSRTGRHL